jgi:hypothetical protein
MTATANSARMQRVEVAGRSILLSEAEIAAFETRFAEVLAETPAAASAPTEPLGDAAEPLDIPNFAGTDAEVLAASKPAEAKPAASGPSVVNQRLLIAIGGLALTLLIIAVSVWSGGGQPPRQNPLAVATTPPTTAAAAAAAAATAAATPTTAAGESTVVAYFDYLNPESSTAITPTGILRIDGQAGDWRRVSLSGDRGQVWLKLADVPAGLASADPLPDLAPRPTSPPAPARPTVASGGSNSGGGAPAQCETEADLRYHTEYDVLENNMIIGHVTGHSCYSQAEADQKAAANEKVVRAQEEASKKTAPTMPPTATNMPLSPPTSTPAR